MVDLHAGLCALPVELKELILSKIEHIEAHHILALSSTFQEAFSLLRALPRTFDYEGVEGVLADHLVRLLDDDRVRSLGKERALQLIGDGNKDRLCQYACGRNFEVLEWAHNKLGLPWAPYRAGRVSHDILVLRVLREIWPQRKQCWRVDVGPENWPGVKMRNARVVGLRLSRDLEGAFPAEIGQLTALEWLDLDENELTSIPAEIGQLKALTVLVLNGNQLTSLPAEIGQLVSLTRLGLHNNKLTSVPAEIGQLAALTELYLEYNQLGSVPAAIRELRAAGCHVYLDAGVTFDE